MTAQYLAAVDESHIYLSRLTYTTFWAIVQCQKCANSLSVVIYSLNYVPCNSHMQPICDNSQVHSQNLVLMHEIVWCS